MAALPDAVAALPPMETAVMAVGGDDKCKISCPRDIIQSTNIRPNKKALVADNSAPVACNHDYKSLNVTPSISLFMNMPADPKESFYIGGESGNGRVHVTLWDSVFQPSDVFDHMAQLCQSIEDKVERAVTSVLQREKELFPQKLCHQMDGGPD